MENAIGANFSLVLDWRGSKALVFQTGLIAAAVVLPSFCHLAGAPVLWLLPMHWPVLMAGLVYGWRGGLLVGLSSPAISFALSGMPPAPLLPFFAAEIAVYGFSCGFARQNLRLAAWLSVLIAVIAGRAAYLAAGLFGGAGAHFAALVPGLAAAAAQVALLPPAARKWTE